MQCETENEVNRAGFTLMEMMVVLAIIAILTVAIATSLPALLSARSVANSADSIAGYLNMARSTAMGQNTYVVTGFSVSQGNTGALQLVGFRSLDGIWNVGGTASGATFQAISKPVTFSNLQLTASSQLPANMKSELTSEGITISTDVSQATLGSLPAQLPMTVNTSGPVFSTGVLIFTPQGQVLVPNGTFPTSLSTLTYERLIFIGLVGSHGGTVNTSSSSTQSAVVLVEGNGGKATVYRP